MEPWRTRARLTSAVKATVGVDIEVAREVAFEDVDVEEQTVDDTVEKFHHGDSAVSLL